MIRLLLVTIFVCVICFTAYGQDTVRKSVRSIGKTRLDTNKVVVDKQGNLLHYYQYSRLMNTGEYTIKSSMRVGTPGKIDSLVKLSQQEKLKMYEWMKPMLAIKSDALKEGKELDITPLLAIVNKDDLDKKVIVLVFWYADCPPCTESFASINEIFKQISNPENVIVLAITRDNEQIAAAKLKEKPLLYARLISNAAQINYAYKLNTFPSFVVADKSRIIRFAVTGQASITIPAFKDAIRQVLFQ